MTEVNTRLRGVIEDLDNNETLEFYYMPEEVQEEVEPEYETVPIIGRSAPIHGYSGTGARTLAFTLMFAATHNTVNDVMRKVQWVQSLKYPRYEGTFMFPPPRLRLTVGSGFIDMDCFLQSASVTYKAPYDVTSGLSPMLASVSLTFTEHVISPSSLHDIREQNVIGDAKGLGESGDLSDML